MERERSADSSDAGQARKASISCSKTGIPDSIMLPPYRHVRMRFTTPLKRRADIKEGRSLPLLRLAWRVRISTRSRILAHASGPFRAGYSAPASRGPSKSSALPEGSDARTRIGWPLHGGVNLRKLKQPSSTAHCLPYRGFSGFTSKVLGFRVMADEEALGDATWGAAKPTPSFSYMA